MADYTNGVGPSTSSSSSSSSFLTLILDLNPASWSSTSGTPIASFLPVILVFLSSHLALSHSNGVAFYVCSTQGRGDLIYSTASHSYRAERGDDDDDDEEADSHNDASTYQHFGQMNRAVVRGVKRMIARLQADAKRESEQTNGASKEDGIEEEEEEEETAIVKVLSMALNHLNRIVPSGSNATSSGGSSSNPLPPARSTNVNSTTNPDPSSSSSLPSATPNSRILVLSTTASASNQYIGLMNCIFASQRRDIPIDVLKLSGEDTVFLQQAANLTGGIYFRLQQQDAAAASTDPRSLQGRLLQLLLSTFLPPPALRKQLHLPALDEVDFRASCFCHGEIVDVGYVCGVCLSIFCHPPSQCHICSSPFPRRTLKRFKKDLTAPRGVESGEGVEGQA